MGGELTQKQIYGKILSFIRDAYNPRLFFSIDFQPSRYLENVTDSLAATFNYSLLILRGEDSINKNQLIAIATTSSLSGFDKEYVQREVKVEKDSPIPKLISQTGKIYYSGDLLQDEIFDKKDFAEAALLRSGESVTLKAGVFIPIFKRNKFWGLLACFKQRDLFDKDEREFLEGPLKDAIELIVAYIDDISQRNEELIKDREYASRSMTFLVGTIHSIKNKLLIANLNVPKIEEIIGFSKKKETMNRYVKSKLIY